ncbi:aa3-type cytochrome c oxidase subunit IV [Sphingomonas sp. LY160]|nr:aa3-type cytochrome c oxidase subunit IV [Sphingomonas sp. LY160]MEA1071002.1 aa3-type cytochrome c oxidase subunit IV [Sphingomonas sp. LY160]
MAAENTQHTAVEMDYPAHTRNYSGFLKLLKWGTILSAIVALVVVLIIAN